MDREIGRLELSAIAPILVPFPHFVGPIFLPFFCFDEGRVDERFGEINLALLLKVPNEVFQNMAYHTLSPPLLKSTITRLV